MKNILKISFLVLAFLFTNLGTNASENDKICPFELISFTAETIRDSVNNILIVNLEWQTASEMNTDKFIVERDTLPIPVFWLQDNFCPIGELTAAGNSTTTRTYNFSDTVEWGVFAYRINGVDKDGSFGYSDEIIIDNYFSVIEQRNSNSVSIISNIYPNPVSDQLIVELNPLVSKGLEIQLIDIKGNIVYQSNNSIYNHDKSLIPIELSNINSGESVFIVKVGSIIESRKIVIVK